MKANQIDNKLVILTSYFIAANLISFKMPNYCCGTFALDYKADLRDYSDQLKK